MGNSMKSTGCNEVNSLNSEYKETVADYPDAAPVMEQVHKVLCDSQPGRMYTIKCRERRRVEKHSGVCRAEQDRRQICDTLKGKLLFNAFYDTYTATLNNFKGVLQKSAIQKKKQLQLLKKTQRRQITVSRNNVGGSETARQTPTPSRGTKRKHWNKQLCRRQHRI
jgi:hypothetical protein